MSQLSECFLRRLILNNVDGNDGNDGNDNLIAAFLVRRPLLIPTFKEVNDLLIDLLR